MNLLYVFLLLETDSASRWADFAENSLPRWLKVIRLLWEGFGDSAKVFILTLLISIPLGVIIMLLRRSSFAPIRWLTTFYISVMRGTPLMLQLVVFYYGPYYIFKIALSKIPGNWLFIAILLAFSLNYAAYFAEIFRAGLEAIPVGQYEAAAVLDFGRARTFIYIILPQMAKNVLPPVTNETITLVKDTSLAFTIGYIEMFTVAKQQSASMTSLMPLMAAGIFYYIANLAVAFVMARIEKKFSYYHV